MATSPAPAATLTGMPCDYVQETASASFSLENGGSLSVYLPKFDVFKNPKAAVKAAVEAALAALA